MTGSEELEGVQRMCWRAWKSRRDIECARVAEEAGIISQIWSGGYTMTEGLCNEFSLLSV